MANFSTRRNNWHRLCPTSWESRVIRRWGILPVIRAPGVTPGFRNHTLSSRLSIKSVTLNLYSVALMFLYPKWMVLMLLIFIGPFWKRTNNLNLDTHYR